VSQSGINERTTEDAPPSSSSRTSTPATPTYKAVQRSAQVVSIGPMLQGLAKPVNDPSRGALVDDIVYTLALTAIQSRV
jgi:Phosphate acetyl/butaryl transferase